jgi:protein gp37
VRLVPELLDLPLRWRKPRMVFVNSMSDLFHETVPLEFIRAVFDTMKRANWHVFQILTKRSARLLELHEQLEWPANVWMGVSVENARYIHRADHLRETGARVKFLSVEPLLGPVSALSVEGLQWVIAGGESGPHARPMELGWVREIRDKCVNAGVAFFLKQLGGRRDKRGGDQAVLDGRTWTEYPAAEENALGPDTEPYPNRERSE